MLSLSVFLPSGKQDQGMRQFISEFLTNAYFSMNCKILWKILALVVITGKFLDMLKFMNAGDSVEVTSCVQTYDF